MYRGLIISSGFHIAIVMVSIIALPFVAKKPLDIPPLVSVELIQIAEKTNIPYAPKASKIIEKVKQTSEFEKKETLNLNEIAAWIDKKKENLSETKTEVDKISQSTDDTMDYSKLSLSEEDALKAQIFTCWSVPIGLPFSEDLLVRVKLQLKPDGTIEKLEMLDHIKMNTPGKEKFRTLADSVRRAIQLCNPLKVPTSGYERWKNMILNFDARDMLGG